MLFASCPRGPGAAPFLCAAPARLGRGAVTASPRGGRVRLHLSGRTGRAFLLSAPHSWPRRLTLSLLSSSNSVILVANHLPVTMTRSPETGDWVFEWDEDALLSQAAVSEERERSASTPAPPRLNPLSTHLFLSSSSLLLGGRRHRRRSPVRRLPALRGGAGRPGASRARTLHFVPRLPRLFRGAVKGALLQTVLQAAAVASLTLPPPSGPLRGGAVRPGPVAGVRESQQGVRGQGENEKE